MPTAPQPAQGTLVMAPVSPAVAALLHALQAQIIQEAAAQSAATLDPMGDLQAPSFRGVTRLDSCEVLEYRGTNGRDTFRRRFVRPDGWADVPWHPSHWRLSSERTDHHGRRWDRYDAAEIHVVDDFGFLAPIPAVFQ